jgi:hydrogenase maturation protein HypF
MLVMTSGNLAEEPIAYTNPVARQQLSSLADGFLMHNRPIRVRCDDSVMRVSRVEVQNTGSHPDPDEALLPVRRSRGYAPYPVKLAWDMPPILAAGAELKNTFCITRDRYAFLSQHIGDMENYETLQAFEDSIRHFERLFRISPELLAYDLHPNYLASRYILDRSQKEGHPAVAVQHHHAHIVACMAENGLQASDTVIGVAFDGTGYGDDGAIWGGEFLLASYQSYQRLAHLRYVPLPGGDRSVREPWRIALAYLHLLGLEWSPDLAPVAFGQQALSGLQGGLEVLSNQIANGINTPPTSSMGRLFDAVASLAGIRQTVNYEAQAAIELEATITLEAAVAPYPFDISASAAGQWPRVVDPAPLFAQILADLRSGQPAGTIAARFHTGIARMVLEVCRQIRQSTGCEKVALSGGVWQNTALLTHTIRLLTVDRFHVFTHHRVPPNDGGLALGQALIASQVN